MHSGLRVAILIDGGHLRHLARDAGYDFTPELIERVAHACRAADERMIRILYYDCAPFNGTVRLPVSGMEREYNAPDNWMKDLAARDLFAVRRGVLKFRGFKPRRVPVAGRPLSDDDFKPDFEQKGVDMRIGLDIATMAANRTVERITLLTGDTDCLPAMKHARINGLQVALAIPPKHRPAPELLWHSDFRRDIAWPDIAPAAVR